MLAPIQPLVQSHQDSPQGERHDDCHDSCSAVHAHRNHISGSGRAGVHVRSIDTAGIGDGVDAGKSGGTLSRRAGDGVTNPGKGNHVAGVDAGNHEHHGHVARCSGSRAGGKNECSDCEAEGDGDVEEALTGAVCVDGIAEGGDNGQTVWWRGQTQTDDLAVAQCLYDYTVVSNIF